MNRKVLFGIAAIAIIFVFILIKLTPGTSNSTSGAPWEKTNVEQMKQELNQNKSIIVDLREPELYQEGHISGAINIPFTEFQDRYQELDPNKRIVFVCHDGPMGEASCQFLSEKGYRNLANLQGGMSAWDGPLTTK